MSRDPGSAWRPLPESSGTKYVKTQLIVHSTGSLASAAANARYFAQEKVAVESHFIVGLTAADPTLQVMDTDLRADASYTASKRAISIEVVGDGVGEFTPWQVGELVRIGRWAHQEHGIRLRLCPAHDADGYGWHVMFGAPGPWTTVRGKVCPGRARIRQLETAIFPAIFRTPTPPAPTPKAPAPSEEDEMVRIVQIGTGAERWVVDFGARTRWRIKDPDQQRYLERVGLKVVDGPQAPQLFDGFRTIEPAA